MIVLKEKTEISNPQAVYKCIRKILHGKDIIAREKEHFFVIILNTRNIVKVVELVSIGTISSSLVHPREVYRRAILKGATSIILAHNHPSGNPEPSEEDIKITRRLAEAGKIIGIELVDHIVVGYGLFISFKEKGLI